MANQKEKLFKDFQPVSSKEWMDKIIADLKGADFDKKLVWKTNEGFNVNPFYVSDDLKDLKTPTSLPGEFPYVRGTKTNNQWLTRQDICVKDAKDANTKALDILNKGVNSIGFEISSTLATKETIEVLLKGISLELVELNFSTCMSASANLVDILVEYYKNSGCDLSKCCLSLDYDPFKTITKKGQPCDNWADIAADIVEKSVELPKFRVLAINAYKLSDGGAFIYQELGFALANGNELISKLLEKSISLSVISNKIKFNFGISSNYFMEIAKFRAARWLWAIIIDAYIQTSDCTDSVLATEATKILIHATTSKYNQTIYDAHVNLLRSQTESMSATIGGVHSLSVIPFDDTFQTPNDFSERVARNQQLLLKEECHFDKIVDASAGSYYIENLTNSIAEQAWKLFLATNENGYYEDLKKGDIQRAVSSSSAKRNKALDTRKEILLGTNQYPNFNETASSKIKKENKPCGCTKGNLETLPTNRLAENFEELRLSTERSGKRPKTFMLTIGNLAMRLARAQFACNFFACAGYEVIDNLGFQSVADGIKAAREVGADIIVLCSSDDEYAQFAPEAFELIKAGKEQFVVAGAPACAEELRAKGINNFINVKSNVLEVLQGFNKTFGI